MSLELEDTYKDLFTYEILLFIETLDSIINLCYSQETFALQNRIRSLHTWAMVKKVNEIIIIEW
jgi:Zn-finger domain-containing protein